LEESRSPCKQQPGFQFLAGGRQAGQLFVQQLLDGAVNWLADVEVGVDWINGSAISTHAVRPNLFRNRLVASALQSRVGDDDDIEIAAHVLNERSGTV
jgi:hypothetical protein